MWSDPEGSIRKRAETNLFINNLDKENVDPKVMSPSALSLVQSDFLFQTLDAAFAPFGEIFSCKIATDGEGHSKGYGFVQYLDPECAKLAIEGFDGKDLFGKKVHVTYYKAKEVSASRCCLVLVADTVSNPEAREEKVHQRFCEEFRSKCHQ